MKNSFHSKNFNGLTILSLYRIPQFLLKVKVKLGNWTETKKEAEKTKTRASARGLYPFYFIFLQGKL